MSRVITVNPLRVSSIKDAVKQLEDYKKKLETFPEEFTRAMTEYFVAVLQTENASATFKFLEDVYITVEGGKAEGVVVFDGHVQFVEFGTGAIGLFNHGGINQEWLEKIDGYSPDYNKGTHIRHVIHDQDSAQDYWVFNKDGKFYTTHGVPANPFIYRSVKDLLEARASIGRTVFERGF